jgi:fatty-acyl-CoA synthase
MHALGGFADHLHIVNDAPVDILVFDPERFGERAAELAKQAPRMKLIAFGASTIAEDLCKLAERFQPAPLVAPKVDGATIARLSYTGGTTGKPKAITGIHRTALAAAQIMLAEWEWPNPPRVLSCAPLSHAGAAMVLPTLMKQGTILIHPSFDPLKVLQSIQAYRINCMLLVPTMIYKLLNHAQFAEFDLSSLETIFYGASAISPALLKEAIERIGSVFFQFYGQAEAPMTITVLRKAEHDVNDLQRLASCGRPVPWVRVELLDTTHGHPVPDGEPGEICVQGPLVMNGYRNDPDQTAEALKGGWLHTGDIAVRDPGGFLRIIDRAKDMIIRGAFNIYPSEIEIIIGKHRAVAEVAVIGVPDPQWGEAIKALVVTRPGETARAEELIALVEGAKAPQVVEFIDSIPLTSVGKYDKKALRAKYGQPAG